MQQGNDKSTQYRSGIYAYSGDQKHAAEQSKIQYQQALTVQNHPEITTEILDAPEFYYAEDYHQQYLAKNPMVTVAWVGLGFVWHKDTINKNTSP